MESNDGLVDGPEAINYGPLVDEDERPAPRRSLRLIEKRQSEENVPVDAIAPARKRSQRLIMKRQSEENIAVDEAAPASARKRSGRQTAKRQSKRINSCRHFAQCSCPGQEKVEPQAAVKKMNRVLEQSIFGSPARVRKSMKVRRAALLAQQSKSTK